MQLKVKRFFSCYPDYGSGYVAVVAVLHAFFGANIKCDVVVLCDGGCDPVTRPIFYQSDREYTFQLRGQDFLYQFQSESPAGNGPAASPESAICRANSLGVL